MPEESSAFDEVIPCALAATGRRSCTRTAVASRRLIVKRPLQRFSGRFKDWSAGTSFFVCGNRRKLLRV